MTEVDADVIVVGAGPAGSAAAIAAARAGGRVILLDRAAFPRDKPCGDLIGVRALRWARRLGIDERDLAPYPRLGGALVVAEGTALALAPASPLGRRLLAGADARVIPRRDFDAALVRVAQRAGVALRQFTVRGVEPWDGARRVLRGAGPDGPARLAAPAVVIAGGYGCRVARDVAPDGTTAGPAPPRAIAMRGYFTHVAVPADRIVFCLNDWILPGYGWLFPLPDGGANVGVGRLVAGGGDDREPLRDLYERFVRHPASPAARWLAGATPVGTPRAWPLDLGPRPRRLVADGLLAAGEAAALVGPLTGAGIAMALASGALAGVEAAEAVRRGDVRAAALAPYDRRVRRHQLRWLRLEAAAQRVLRDPGHLHALLAATRSLPAMPTLGALLLLHLG